MEKGENKLYELDEVVYEGILREGRSLLRSGEASDAASIGEYIERSN